VDTEQAEAGNGSGTMPGHAPIQARESLERGHPREQHDLDEGQVGPEQAGQPPGPHEARGEIVHIARAMAEPQSGADDRVGGEDELQDERREPRGRPPHGGQ
jgi:hypothetical protein